LLVICSVVLRMIGFAMMKKLVGRKILRVFVFCFVSISVSGHSENVLRNDLPLLLSCFDHSTIQPFNHPTIQPFDHSTIQQFDHSTILLNSIFPFANHWKSLSQTFFSHTSLPSGGLALGYFILALNPLITRCV
jgi:hypothetical protein